MSEETTNPTAEETTSVPTSEETKPETQVDPSDSALSQDSEYEEKLRLLEEEKSKITNERDNLKVALTESREKQKALKAEVSQEPAKPEVNSDQLRELVEEVTNEKVQTLRTDLAVATFDKILGQMTSHPKEKELIKHHYKHSVKSSGVDEASIRKDLILAKAAANLEHIKFGNQPQFDPRVSSAMASSGGKDAGMQTDPEERLSEADKLFKQKFQSRPTRRAARKR